MVDDNNREAVTQPSPGLPRFVATLGLESSNLRQPRRGCAGFENNTTPMGLSSLLQLNPRVAARRGNPGLSYVTALRLDCSHRLLFANAVVYGLSRRVARMPRLDVRVARFFFAGVFDRPAAIGANAHDTVKMVSDLKTVPGCDLVLQRL